MDIKLIVDWITIIAIHHKESAELTRLHFYFLGPTTSSNFCQMLCTVPLGHFSHYFATFVDLVTALTLLCLRYQEDGTT